MRSKDDLICPHPLLCLLLCTSQELVLMYVSPRLADHSTGVTRPGDTSLCCDPGRSTSTHGICSLLTRRTEADSAWHPKAVMHSKAGPPPGLWPPGHCPVQLSFPHSCPVASTSDALLACQMADLSNHFPVFMDCAVGNRPFCLRTCCHHSGQVHRAKDGGLLLPGWTAAQVGSYSCPNIKKAPGKAQVQH